MNILFRCQQQHPLTRNTTRMLPYDDLYLSQPLNFSRILMEKGKIFFQIRFIIILH